MYLFDNGGEASEGEPMTIGTGDDRGAQLDDDPLGGGQLVPAQEGRLSTLLLQAQRGAVALVYRVETPVLTQNEGYIAKKKGSNYLPVILKGQRREMVLGTRNKKDYVCDADLYASQQKNFAKSLQLRHKVG